MERWDDLQYKDLWLLQDDTLPCFTSDAVKLVHFLRLGPKDRVLDAGCGTGLLSVLGQAYTGASFTGVDICPEPVALAVRSAKRNGQDIRFETMDILDAPAYFGEGAFTAAVWNPPYFMEKGNASDPARDTARHADAAELTAQARAVFRLLKNGGRLFVCCPCAQMARVMTMLSACRLEPKRMRLVAHTPQDAPYLALIEAKKDGHGGIVTEPLLFDKEA